MTTTSTVATEEEDLNTHWTSSTWTWTTPFQVSWWVQPLHMTFSCCQLGQDTTTPIISKDIDDKNITQHSLQEDDEVLGWTMDAAARGVAIMGTAVFVSSELLKLAKEAAGCSADLQSEAWMGECYNRIHGMRPSSILTNIVMIVGLCSAILMPFIGSIIDHTPYRRAVGSFSAACMVFFILLQMIVLQERWFSAAILQIFIAFSYTVHLCAVYAYLPELTDNQERMVQYAAKFSAAQYSGSVGFLIVMIGVLSWINKGDRFNSATLSQTVVFIICGACFGYAWTQLFRPRPASQVVPENRTLLSSGFWKIYKTGRTILLHHSAIKWFLVAAAFSEAATTTFSTIAITYMTEQLGFDSRENGIAILILLLFGIPGTRLAAWLNTLEINPIRSLQASLVLWITSIIASVIILDGANQQYHAYVFAMIWGVAIGWAYPTEKALYVTIIPRGQEAELMGCYICACQMLSWLPPLVFSIMNESGLSMRLGLLSLTVYFMVSFGLLFLVGDYDEAVAHAKEVDEGRGEFATSPKGAGIDGYGCYERWPESMEMSPQDGEGDHESKDRIPKDGDSKRIV